MSSRNSEKKTRSPDGNEARVRYFHVENGSGGQRLDNYLLARFKSVPKSHVYRIIRSGQVRVNGGRAQPSRRLNAGDAVRVPPVRTSTAPPPAVDEEALQQFRRSIVFEDEHLLLINKSGYTAVHGGSRHSYGLAEISRRLYDGAGFPALVHRLDRNTSGCLLFAKTREALLGAQRAFRLREAEKTYIALVAGAWDEGVSSVTAPLAISPRARRKKVVVDSEQGKPAATDFEIVLRFDRCTLLKAMPRTGRMHQIRVHAASCGHPVAGDRRYGDDAVNRYFQGLGLKRLFLHASDLRLRCLGRDYSFSAPLPEDIDSLLVTIRQRRTAGEKGDDF